METRVGSWRWTWAGGLLWAAQAAQAAPELELPSCVTGSPPLRVAADAPRAALDGTDRQRFQAAAQARYPLYQRGGHALAQVLMLRRGAKWLYVTLAPSGAKDTCVTAVFAAERFDFTDGWIAKYRPAGSADD